MKKPFLCIHEPKYFEGVVSLQHESLLATLEKKQTRIQNHHMAPNFLQTQPAENLTPNDSTSDSNNSSPSTTTSNQLEQLLLKKSQVPDGAGSSSGIDGCSRGEKLIPDKNGTSSSISCRRTLNEANFIQSRRFNFSPRTKKSLELLCEDKVSKYKLEEVHYSLPSSIKSTFIMTFSPDGRKVASTHGDHCIYICDLNTGKLLGTLEGHPKTPWCLAWHPCNKEILASGCLAGEVRVWDLQSKACESWTSKNNTIITSLDFHPKERILVIATANDIHFWDWSESEPFAKTTTTHDKEKVKFVEFDSSGTKLITGISNLPKIAGYSSDSLQNRIIDSYLNQAPLDQLSTENMTQNSEITSPISSGLNSIEPFNEGNASLDRLSTASTSDIDQDINYRSTITLSRVSTLYRQLETLEDSMRHTTFSPYINPRSIESQHQNDTTTQQEQERESLTSSSTNQSSELENANQSNSGRTPTTTQNRDQMSKPPVNNSQAHQSTRASNAIEPFVVSFDESLEQLQLRPLVLDGHEINLATVIEQYPIDSPNQLNFVMQYNSINQVNQNFIRISKLMSSVRLYRQVVQQILSSNLGQGHYQPNQILTAQSSSPRSSRQPTNLPILFRNFNPAGLPSGVNRLGRNTRPTDPILAIQFRNSARNVPLVTICKIDLLCARTVFITRSQQLIEQAISGRRSQSTSDETSNVDTNERSTHPNLPNDHSRWNSIENSPPFHHLLNQLHQFLTNINHAPLTTSNVHTHISLLRSLINNLLKTMSSMFQNQDEGRKIINLVHNIAHSLTGRSWDIPLGATLDDIRLDVIHTMCIVDLTLHLTRQVQLLQLQRLSAVARVEVSQRASNQLNERASLAGSSSTNEETAHEVQADTSRPSTSRGSITPSNIKRKDSGLPPNSDESIKRRKMAPDQSSNLESNNDIEMNTTQHTSSSTTASIDPAVTCGQTFSTSATQYPLNLASNPQPSTSVDSLASDRLVLWNSPPAPTLAQSYQRFLAQTSNMCNNGILVHIYLGSLSNSALNPNTAVEQSAERPVSQPVESRRRALSQDNSGAPVSQEGTSNQTSTDYQRTRQVNVLPTSSAGQIGASFDATWQRQPHLHVYQTRGSGQHLWFNQWTIPLPMNNCNYRVQCWNFSLTAIPNIKDPQSNVITQKCRIHNDASIDISSDGGLIACLVPRDDGGCLPSFDLKVFSLKSYDFGVCYHQLPHGPNAVSVSMSPSGQYAVVGLASNKFVSSDPSEDDLTIAKVFKLNGKHPYGYIRDIKIKRDDSSLSLNAIRWMARGIVYNVGPQHHQRYQATRIRNRVV